MVHRMTTPNTSPFSGHKLTLRAPRAEDHPYYDLHGHGDQVAAVLEGEDLGACVLVLLDANGDVLWHDDDMPNYAANHYRAGAVGLYRAWQAEQAAAAAQ